MVSTQSTWGTLFCSLPQRQPQFKSTQHEIDAFGRSLRGCCRCLPPGTHRRVQRAHPILRSAQLSDETGKYSYSYETGNGISIKEEGVQKLIGDKPEEVGSVSRGSYSYELEGVTYTVSWVADENGFQATGDHLPTPPPMPEHVVKLLADLRAAGQL